MLLQAHSDWQEVQPRHFEHSLAVSDGKALRHLAGTGKLLAETPWSSLRDSPLTTLPGQAAIAAYTCNNRPGSKDYSCLARWDASTGRTTSWKNLGLNQWVTGLLTTAPPHFLIGMLVTDVPGQHIHIRHQLAIWSLKDNRSRIIPLCRDSIQPLAIHTARKQVLFQGSEGIQLVGLDGRRTLHFPNLPEQFPRGRGGSFHPTRRQALIGGNGIYLLDEPSQRLTQLLNTGHYPLWHTNTNSFWYSHTSADIYLHNIDTGQSHCIVAAANNAYPELLYARPLFADNHGRYIAASLTRACPPPHNTSHHNPHNSPNTQAHINPRDLKRERTLLILDTSEKIFWQINQPADQITFLTNTQPTHNKTNP